MALNFPNSPSNGQRHDAANGITYKYDGDKWVTLGSYIANTDPDAEYVSVSGDTMTGGLTVPSLNSGQLAGFRNQLINGDFGVNQRGIGPFSASIAYTSDRWKAVNGSMVTVATGGAYGTNKLSINGTTVCQAVELTPNPGRVGVFPVGSQWTFSIWATAQPTDFTAAFVDRALDGTNAVYVVSSTAMTSTTETDNGFTKYTITFTINASQVSSNFGFQVALNNYTGDVTLAQLEPGPVATPFEHRPIGVELALCQRYYQLGQGSYRETYPKNLAATYSAINFPTTMRVAPTFPSPLPYLENDSNRLDAMNAQEITPYSFVASALVLGGTGDPVYGRFSWTADAEL